MSERWQSPSDKRVLARRDMTVRHAPPDSERPPDLVVGVALHNQATTLSRCLESIWAQDLGGIRLVVVLLNDRSTDDWADAATQQLGHSGIFIVDANCGSAARARNAILDFVDASIPSAKWVARLDADDRFFSPKSLASAVIRATQTGAKFVVGGNRLYENGVCLTKTNPASSKLLEPGWVVDRLCKMADGTADNELPSCNLLLATGTGWRYPDAASAEDHWLVADLLINHGREGAVLEEPYFADYTLRGQTTRTNDAIGKHRHSRLALYEAARAWVAARTWPGTILGVGREGIVRQIGDQIEKHFYPGCMSQEKVTWLTQALRGVHPHLPEPNWMQEKEVWRLQYRSFETTAAAKISVGAAKEFLLACLRAHLVCANIKRSNFRLRGDGGLMFVDIGAGIIPMNVDYFIDSAARLFAISALGWADDELRRRESGPRTEETLESLPGFADFYCNLLKEHGRSQWAMARIPDAPVLPQREDSVTLLIKACAMDAVGLGPHVRHIVSQLSRPRSFHERVLLVDPYRGPYLRQHKAGDYDLLLAEGARLREAGIIDRILVAPNDPPTVSAINERWFGLPCPQTHSIRSVPVTPQVWGFDQVHTRFVLQCDVDVLVGRRDLSHDYLAEMLHALMPKDVVGVGFNIPHAPGSMFKPYDALPGEFVPEVRCGLLDLSRIRACLPLPNDISDGRLCLTWYRSLQKHQQRTGMRTLRGGDPRTFYIHPPNDRKHDLVAMSRIRDLVAQGLVPPVQFDHWDLAGAEADWRYASRHESIVFVVKGRDTPIERVRRCFQSLAMQEDQGFGVVVIDDASTTEDPSLLPHLLGSLAARTTLIRRETHAGRIPNMRTAIGEICVVPESLIVILDLDDALVDCSTTRRLRAAIDGGADVVLAGMFRPDKPIKLYHPGFVAPRSRWGDEVWVHLRSFRKWLFDALPADALQLDGDWIEQCTDYATMIPIVEMCTHPVYLPQYLYFHERSTPRTRELRIEKDAIIRRILAKPSLLRL